ncbi:HAMP domain-containing histidine kinase [Kitasatospora sp. NBC_00070]|uniref:HAMP domain-containing sensor histidine kinase n=1 Tax=Kitasatospora sp. NBC_00070 TaxID=2975962 RepID=UPI00324C1E75
MSMITIRGRLTLWYAAVFVATGAAVLAAMYYLVRREFISAGQAVIDGIGTPVAVEPSGVAPSGPGAHPSAMAGTPLPSVSAQPANVEAATTQARTDALRTIVLDTGALFAVLTVVSLLLCWLVARRALRPLRQITATAAELSHDSLDARIALPGPRDEIRTLADAFDAMLDRLQRAFRSQRLFVANASHELRTPLTIIRTAAEMALDRETRPEAQYRQALATIATAATRSDAILTSLLHLAQTRHSPTRTPVDLDRLAADAAAAWPADAPRLRTHLDAAPCTGDPTQLELLLRNLLDNAVRYNTDPGEVWLATGRGDRTCWLRVDNTGPVVRPGDVPALREPFQRGATRTGTTGAGLGLAIVDAIADAHGARLTAAARPGGGLTVTLTLPVR